MTPPTRANNAGARPNPPNASWDAAWACVPEPWRDGVYRLDEAPWSEVFVRNTNYLRSAKEYDFRPAGAHLAGQQVAWWVWTVWAEGTRKIDPAMLAWWQRAVASLSRQGSRFRGNPAGVSIADLAPADVIGEALRQFHARHGRRPSPGNLRNLESVAYSIHEHVSIRCSPQPWWRHDTWSLTLDPRIPRREHEPHGHRPIAFSDVEPQWLREGLRFWLSQCLVHDILTWTTTAARRTLVGTYLGGYLHEHDVREPALASDRTSLRALMTSFLAWLRSPQASSRGRVLSPNSVAAIQSAVQRFYDFMLDNADAATEFTGHHGWTQLTGDHQRLWPAQARRTRMGNQAAPRYLSTTDVQRMLVYLDVLSTNSTDVVTVGGAPHGPVITVMGLGDPQAARAWMLQALTGRRVSEILMLDFNPLTRFDLAGTGTHNDEHDPDAFVARLRYQQTKVDGVDPTIPVERAVVTLIEEQQQWVRQSFPEARDHRHLFLNPTSNHKGLRPRSHASQQAALRRLDAIVNLVDQDEKPLRYTQTHRLRHTKATELLNADVPVHVVQRYLGHKSPEMTMRYAATLAATEQAAFLRYKKVGADGRDLGIDPVDLYDLSHLTRRADRALPNGLCLLPPTQSCDKGNACLPCPSFATDATHLDEHRSHHSQTTDLIAQRRERYRQRTGTDLPDGNIWLQGRLRELASLEAIIERLSQPDATNDAGVAGGGCTSRGAVPVSIVTAGAHTAVLRSELSARLSAQPAPGPTRRCDS